MNLTIGKREKKKTVEKKPKQRKRGKGYKKKRLKRLLKLF